MKEEAIKKLAEECEKYANKPIYTALVAIEEHYTEIMTEKIAEKLLQENRNIHGAYKKMEDFARAGRLCCVTPDEAWHIIDDYYGIVAEDYEKEDHVPDIEIEDDFDILDFLEE